MTSTVEETGVLESLDFSPICDIEPCERDADWIVTFSCCLSKHFYCDTHLKDVREAKELGFRFFCPICHTGDIVEPFADIQRLKP